jgi:hypothetical protein
MFTVNGNNKIALDAVRVTHNNNPAIDATADPIPFNVTSLETTAGMHDTATNNDRLVVVNPGIALAMGTLSRGSQTGQIAAYIKHYNSSDVEQGLFASADTDTSGGDDVCVTTPPISVAVGDYFVMEGYADTGSTAADSRTHFGMIVFKV